MKHFWTHKERIPEGYGYGQFSLAHLLWITATVIFTVLAVFFYQVLPYQNRIVFLRTIAASLIISDIIKMIVIKVTGINVWDYLPLELCSFAAYFIVCDSLWTGNSVLPQLLLTLFFPAAIMAVFFPTTSTLPSFNFHTIHQFFFHGLIIIYVAVRFFASEITLSYIGLWRSVLIACALAAIMYVVDTKFDKNFMFLRDSYGNVMLDIIYNKTKGNIGYIGGLVCFSIVVMHIFFFIFKLIEILLLN